MAAPPPQQPDVFDPLTLLLPSPGSRLSHRELEANEGARNPAPENPMPEPQPAFSKGDPRLSSFTVLPPRGEGGAPPETPRDITLVRAEGAERAYAHLPMLGEIILNHLHPEWGRVFFAVIYYRVKNTSNFQAPQRGRERYAAIKKLKKSVIDESLRQGGKENPYKEFARGAEIGDNIHVLKPYEFLTAHSIGEGRDEEYLYICSPKACELGTLQDFIPDPTSNQVVNRDFARRIFCKVLQILLYLESKNINHHDMSPDNFLFLAPDNLVVFDLALSLRIPENPTTGQRALIAAQEPRSGTHAYMPPEVFYERDFDGVGMDLYSAGVILYKLLTNRFLFYRPSEGDLFFRHYVFQQGLWDAQYNTRVVECHDQGLDIVIRTAREQQRYERFVKMAVKHLHIHPDAMSLLKHLLAMDPSARYSLAEAINSDYVQRPVQRR